jgi:hypothetical protein
VVAATLDLDRLVPVHDQPSGRRPTVDGTHRDSLPWAVRPNGPPADRRIASFDQGEFARHLARCGVLDLRPVALPGSAVVLPFGMRLMRRFEAVVRRRYEEQGFDEYDYPMLAPVDVMSPAAEVISLDGRLFFAGDDLDWAAGRRRAVLSPTGEAIVYTHWARTVHTAQDLPIRMYRQARYFRPSHAGQGLFRATEAVGIYEFQACYPDRSASDQGMVEASRMARDVCRDAHVPVLWSNRPPWTNNTPVAERWIGADVPLPHGATVQVGCVYDQGERFSRPYGVRWHDGTALRFTRHVTGCVTQRLVLAHLYLGMTRDGDLLVHPDLAPVQVGVTSGGPGTDSRALAERLADRLRERGLRVARETTTRKRDIGKLHRQWARQGVPIRVYVQDPRFPGDSVRVVVVRADTRAEATARADDLDRLVDGIEIGTTQVGAGYLARATGFVADRCTRADADTIRDVLTDRRVAVCPLEPTEQAVRAVERWRLGEVLGLNRSAEPARCVITDRLTHGVAYISPRT